MRSNPPCLTIGLVPGSSVDDRSARRWASVAKAYSLMLGRPHERRPGVADPHNAEAGRRTGACRLTSSTTLLPVAEQSGCAGTVLGRLLD